jgi:hypothetical protein
MNKNDVNPNGKHQWCLWMQSMSMLKWKENVVKSKATLPLKQMVPYEQCMKSNVVTHPPPPPAPKLNRWQQKGQGTWSQRRKDCMTNIGKILNGCGKWGGKMANGPKKDEGTSWNKLRRVGMMGGWMEVGAHPSIRVKLTISFPSSACWKG